MREDDLKMARETCDLYLADFQRCNRERVLAEGRATKSEEDTTTMRVTRAGEVEDARNRGYMKAGTRLEWSIRSKSGRSRPSYTGIAFWMGCTSVMKRG